MRTLYRKSFRLIFNPMSYIDTPLELYICIYIYSMCSSEIVFDYIRGELAGGFVFFSLPMPYRKRKLRILNLFSHCFSVHIVLFTFENLAVKFDAGKRKHSLYELRLPRVVACALGFHAKSQRIKWNFVKIKRRIYLPVFCMKITGCHSLIYSVYTNFIYILCTIKCNSICW